MTSRRRSGNATGFEQSPADLARAVRLNEGDWLGGAGLIIDDSAIFGASGCQAWRCFTGADNFVVALLIRTPGRI